ncbi:hypothetical protein [Deinococcus arenicola]|uniref:Uncharacterized protein n=1 Tax=Deinococcus arenicola TaxID=2994950 RepID=A0ABU4DW94_9DEIO|nr:hypothetical protein [Deinococcus sp. ZS9-10]MDV6376145.1 hypothetical protein [Deinococcus sp. ZS9-10]
MITRLIIGIPNHLSTARAVDASSHTEAINCNLSLHMGQQPLHMADDGWEYVRPVSDALRATLERSLLIPVDWHDLADPGDSLQIEAEVDGDDGPEWRPLDADESAELLPLIQQVLPLHRVT